MHNTTYSNEGGLGLTRLSSDLQLLGVCAGFLGLLGLHNTMDLPEQHHVQYMHASKQALREDNGRNRHAS